MTAISTPSRPRRRQRSNDARLTPGSAASLTTAAFHGAYVTMGVAPGDGDLLPPRFNGDGKVDAEEWVQDLLDYVQIRI